MIWYVLMWGGLSVPALFLALFYLRWRARSVLGRVTALGALVGGLVPCLWVVWLAQGERGGAIPALIQAMLLGAWLWVFPFTALGAVVGALLSALLVPREQR
jgi:hypothetical protein